MDVSFILKENINDFRGWIQVSVSFIVKNKILKLFDVEFKFLLVWLVELLMFKFTLIWEVDLVIDWIWIDYCKNEC